MIETKFRGKTEAGKWVYGDRLHKIHKETFITNITFMPGISIPASEFTEVIPSSVGQFSGFQDKQMNDIYDGDIFVCGGIYYRLKRDIGKAYNLKRMTGGLDSSPGAYFLFSHHGVVTICGNETDNPELIS